MTKSFLRLGMFLLVGIVFLATSCNKDSELNETELDEFAEEVIFRTQQSQNMGPFGCYELVFPVTIVFPNQSTAEVDSYESMKRTIISWRKENRRVRARPQLQFPYTLLNDEGEVIVVEDLAQQMQVRKDCRESFLDQNGPQVDRPKRCFTIVFPVNITISDGSIVEISSKENFRRKQNETKR